jgi:HlyD family secretion protein
MEQKMKRNMLTVVVLMLIVLSFSISSCNSLNSQSTNQSIAYGTISAQDVKISSETGGKVIDIAVKEGDVVARGDILFRLDDAIIQAHYNQAQAVVDVAHATIDAAKAQLVGAQLQYELTVQAARMEEIEARNNAWLTSQAEEIDLPVWYFQKDEQILALETEVQDAEADLEIKLANLEQVLQDAGKDDFIETEKELVQMQQALKIASMTLQQAEAANDDELVDVAQKTYDSIWTNLNAVQRNYDRILSTDAAKDVLKARAEVAVARSRLDNARDQLILFLQGEDSLQVKAAFAAAEQARAAVTQAEANLAQAQAALELLEIQIEKTIVYAPMDGIILSRNLEIGETVAPGVPVMVIAQLNQVELVVYIPEAEYGRIYLEQGVSIKVDSFPGETFAGEVVHISDQAEFTPRNVQTIEGRRATVYAIELKVPNPEGKLKPGMPADVTFDIK